MKNNLLLLFFALSSMASAKTYYVATGGSNSNTGTFAKPFATWQKGIDMSSSGDTIYIRGGVYYITATDGFVTIDPTIGHGKSGTRTHRTCLWAYPPDYAAGNFPILDCKYAHTAYSTNYSAVGLNATQYWHIKGITVRNAYQRKVSTVRPQGIGATNAANIIFENCSVHNITSRGFYYESGAWNTWDGPSAPWTSDTTRWINCDAYNICDSISLSAGDPWKCGNYLRGVFYFTGCRAWNYSDDGFDPSGAGKRIFSNCIAMSTNKYLSLGAIEGNGFKTSAFGPDQAAHFNVDSNYVVVKNCLAIYCHGVGFYTNLESTETLAAQNNSLYLNNSSYKCYTGFEDVFKPPDHGNVARTSVYKNNLVYSSTSSDYDQVAIYYPSIYSQTHNTWINTNLSGGASWPGWQYNPAVTVTNADFVSLDSSQVRLPRKADGSLPDITLLKLAAGSDLIDAGIDVGLPFYGSAPDIGYSEYVSGPVKINPVYVSSVIENTTPSRLEITYSLFLANIAPAGTAFTVLVNSNLRAVSSVAISGSKVILTLASPVSHGELVTVAYNKPAINPIQTVAGGQASSLVAQTVTNNVGIITVDTLPKNGNQSFKVFPNPAREFVTIQLDNSSSTPDYIQFVDMAGRIVERDKITPENHEISLPIDLKNGVYIIELVSGKIAVYTQKLIVRR
jgi:uncharacterized repeat protein (TIGR02059 family)